MKPFSEIAFKGKFFSPFYNEDFLKIGSVAARFLTGSTEFLGKEIDFQDSEMVMELTEFADPELDQVELAKQARRKQKAASERKRQLIASNSGKSRSRKSCEATV